MAMPCETGRPWTVKVMRAYSSSPKRSAIKPSMACMAGSASGPSMSTITLVPLAAASIITPMMLLAFTRRPLRSIQTSLRNWLAVWVSLAEARACRPSLLMISISLRGIPFSPDVQHAVAGTADGALDQRVHVALAVGQRAQQHRQVQPGDALDATRLEQLARDVRRRRSEDVRQHQHALTGIDPLQHVAGGRQQVERVVLTADAELHDLRRALVEDVV